MNRLVSGTVAGAAATVPMTWAMELMHRLLPAHERYPLPPREVTEELTAKTNLDDRLNEAGHFWLSLASHFGYGAASGALYAGLLRDLPGRPVVKGTAYGLAVWAGSYLGLLPALDLLPPATQHPPRRTALMVAAHLVWGSALGIFTDLLERGQDGDNLRGWADPYTIPGGLGTGTS